MFRHFHPLAHRTLHEYKHPGSHTTHTRIIITWLLPPLRGRAEPDMRVLSCGAGRAPGVAKLRACGLDVHIPRRTLGPLTGTTKAPALWNTHTMSAATLRAISPPLYVRNLWGRVVPCQNEACISPLKIVLHAWWGEEVHHDEHRLQHPPRRDPRPT